MVCQNEHSIKDMVPPNRKSLEVNVRDNAEEEDSETGRQEQNSEELKVKGTKEEA